MPLARTRRLALRSFASLSLLALLAGCAAARGRGRCAGRAQLRCLTPVVCSYDSRLDCEVCRCGEPPYTPLAN